MLPVVETERGCTCLQHFGISKKPQGEVALDRANAEIVIGQNDRVGSTVLKIVAPDQTLFVRFNEDPKTGGKLNCGAEWLTDVDARCATGDVVANAVTIQARFRARGEQKEFEARKASVTNIQALARGKATREQLQQESMPFRVERIVNAMDLDDSGTVHLTELAQFFEVLAMQTSETKAERPKVQARKLMARLTRSDDAVQVETAALAAFLTRTFNTPKGAVQIANMEKAMLQLPVRARIVVDPDPPDKAGVDASLVGQKGVLLDYYNQEKWCYVALDGPGDEASRKRGFKTSVIKEDPEFASRKISEGVPPGGGAAGPRSGDEYDDEFDDEIEEADAVVDDD